MPRTKVAKTVPKVEKEELTKRKKVAVALKKIISDQIDQVQNEVVKHIENLFLKRRIKIPNTYRAMTVAEVKCLSSFSTTMASTMLLETTSQRKPKRSVSCTSDDGYLTTDSASTGSRQSRSRSKQKVTTQSTRTTRSLSRTEKKMAPFKTPANKNPPPNSYALVTPKCKPNTPQVLLRRPKQGEMALSMAGSPLLAAPMVSEETANINIPFSDGNLLSLQPQKGLRLSQIPALDEGTLKQLKLLHENLAKIVEVQSKM